MTLHVLDVVIVVFFVRVEPSSSLNGDLPHLGLAVAVGHLLQHLDQRLLRHLRVSRPQRVSNAEFRRD